MSRSETESRLSCAQHMLAVARRHSDPQDKEAHDPELSKLLRGSVWMLSFAAYEYCLRAGVRDLILELNSQKVPWRELVLSLLPVAATSQFERLRDAGKKTQWVARRDFVDCIIGSNACVVPESTFPEIDYIRSSTVEYIWSVFGLANTAFTSPVQKAEIDKMVNFRNDIAHGKLTASEVGRNDSIEDIERNFTHVREWCLHFYLTVQAACARDDRFRHLTNASRGVLGNPAVPDAGVADAK